MINSWVDKISEQKIYEFDSFRLDAGHRILSRHGKDIELAPKAVETLVALVEHRGEVISKDELLETVWPDTIVDESNLFSYLSHLRKALGNRKDGKPYVETLRRRGYRFTGDVTVARVDRHETPFKLVQPAPIRRSIDNGPVRHSSDSGNVVALANWLEAEPAPGDVKIFEDPTQAAGVPLSDKKTKWRAPFIVTTFAVLVLSSLGVYVWRVSSSTGAATPMKTIAVLPFKPLVSSPPNEHLEVGIAHTLISKLNSTGEINAWPLSSIRKFAGEDRDAVALGRDLGVDYILEGNIQTLEDRIRVSVSLFSVAEGRQVWGRPFEEEFADVFSTQDSIALRVANELRPQLAPDKKMRLTKRGTEIEEAYELYEFGLHHVSKRILPETQKGIEYLQKAIAIDPNYALAYVELANAYLSLTLSGDLPATEVRTKSRDAALKALELDPTLAEAHVGVGQTALWFDRNWKEAEAQAKRALDLEPNNTAALYLLENLYSFTGRHEEAIAAGRAAREADPLSAIFNSIEAQTLLYADRVDEAQERAMKACEIDDNFWHAHLTLSRIYLEKGMYQDAIVESERARLMSRGARGHSLALAFKGHALARSGALTEARTIIDELLSRSERARYYTNVALVYAGLGDKEKALEYLEKGFEEGELQHELKSSPGWKDLRNEVRFVALMEKMYLSD